MRRLARTAFAAVAAAAVLLAGCTSGDGGAPSPSAAPSTAAPTGIIPADPTAAVRASPDAAREAGGATYTFVLAGQAPNGPVDRISGVGRVDFESDVAATRGDFGLASRGRQFDVVTRGTHYWLSVPPQHRTGFVKTPWVGTTTRVARLGMSTLGHPTTYLDVLRAATGMTLVGPEDVRGTATTHYRGSLDVAGMIRLLPAEMQAETRTAFTGVAQVHLEVWLDGGGRPWRLRSRTVAGGATIESAFDITKYGPVPTITLPDRVTALPHIAAVFAAVGIAGAR